jgi:hypothetical protein
MLCDPENDKNIMLRNVREPPAQRLRVIKRKTKRTLITVWNSLLVIFMELYGKDN